MSPNQPSPTVPSPVFASSRVLWSWLGHWMIPRPWLWSPQLLLGQAAPAASPPRHRICSWWFVLCSVPAVLQRSPFPPERALDSPVPCWQEHLWAVFFLKGSFSPCPAGCQVAERAQCGCRGRSTGHSQEGLEGICPGSAASGAGALGKPCSLGLASPQERGRGMRRVCCSPSAPVFFLLKVLAAGETSQLRSQWEWVWRGSGAGAEGVNAAPSSRCRSGEAIY